MLESSVIKLQAFIKKRLQHRFFDVNFLNYSKTPILCSEPMKHQCAILRASFFTEHLQWLLLTVSGFQAATSLRMGLQQIRFSVNFAKFLRTFPDDCFLCFPVILRSFSNYLFYGAPLGSGLFYVQVAEFQPADTVKSISQVIFKHLKAGYL